jgi:Putative Flp pilus-assembly TadE/G-like
MRPDHALQALRRRTRGGRDRGAAMLIVAVLSPVLLGLAGLVFDGGLALEAKQRAADAAEQAARAGANQCREFELRTRSQCVVDGAKAREVIARFNAPGVQLIVIRAEGQIVEVKGQATTNTVFLGLFGYRTIHVESSVRRATAVTGLA